MVIGVVGKLLGRKISVKSVLIVLFTTLILTALFTLLDNVITPLFYAYSKESAKAYWALSLTALIPQEICVLLTVGALFAPLVKLFERIKPFN